MVAVVVSVIGPSPLMEKVYAQIKIALPEYTLKPLGACTVSVSTEERQPELDLGTMLIPHQGA